MPEVLMCKEYRSVNQVYEPPCSVTFRHLAKGRLFRLETDPPAGSPDGESDGVFWLCESCSTDMTLHLARDGDVIPTGLREAIPDGSQLALISLNRGMGAFFAESAFCREAIREARENPAQKMPCRT